MMKSIAALSGLVIWLVALAAPTGASAESAKDNYRLYCVQCHGVLGNGEGVNWTSGGLTVSPRDHTYAKEMSRLTDEEIRLAIAEGGDAVQKSEQMPAWGKVLSKNDIQGLVRYLRQLCKCEGQR
jgi:mono/diheme cytochrome c family protein